MWKESVFAQFEELKSICLKDWGKSRKASIYTAFASGYETSPNTRGYLPIWHAALFGEVPIYPLNTELNPICPLLTLFGTHIFSTLAL